MKNTWTLLIVLLFLLAGCGKDIPSDIIQPKQMESLLYDYHLAMGISNHMKNTEREAYKKYVFNKHQVTEAEFDSSMVWYTREAQELAAIYESLEKRFKREHNQSEALLKSRGGEKIQMTMPGDTVDIWNESDIYWMTGSTLNNMMTFEFKSDSNFHAKDAFLWNMDFHFLTEGKATMGFCVVYDNDSVVGKTKEVLASGKESIRLQTDSAYQVKMLNGFVYVPADSGQNVRILVHNVSLTRYHRAAQQTDGNAQ